ncbi:response regulator [Sphingomonas pokkalii]|uniref:response regulator n=1 Tax=Sphingomonas pokkalii TaxID=2175090 RepID=UPI001F0CBF54|nr:response regulator [Sphingomonas pokkalii]
MRLYLARKLQDVPLEIEERRPSARMGSADETILVVEDDEDVRAYTVGILRELGYRVVEAQDGDGALRLLGGPDIRATLLLTDVVMPRMSGPERAARAQALHPEPRVLFTSGYTRDAIMRDDRLDPNVDLLSKPFTYATLAAKVRELLDRAA